MLINSSENIEHARVDIRYRLCCWQEINTVIGLHFKAASDFNKQYTDVYYQFRRQ